MSSSSKPPSENTTPAADRVEALLRRIATRLVAPGFLSGAALLVGGCSSTHEPVQARGPGAGQPTAPEPGAPLACVDGGVPQLSWLGVPVSAPSIDVAGLTLATTHDYAQVRQVSFGFASQAVVGRQTPSSFTILSELGEPCATATSPDCSQQLAGLLAGVEPSACYPACRGYAVVTTEGDLVEQWSGVPALRELLGAIDGGDEALLLVLASGYDLTCGDATLSTLRELPDGYEVFATRRESDCPFSVRRYRLHVSRAGELRALDSVELPSPSSACAGRKPEGLNEQAHAQGPATLADFLARSAHLEDASVYAFVRMAHELAAHDAPSALIARARAAAQDERRHTRVVRQLAEARGGRVEPARVAQLPVRSLEQIARENVVEGCVRETYGALVGAYQARHAQDLELRSAMASIAEDEARHASLSHALHAWLLSVLPPDACDRVEQAQRRAIEQLREECATMAPESWHAQAGLPSRQVAQTMIAALAHELWQVAA